MSSKQNKLVNFSGSKRKSSDNNDSKQTVLSKFFVSKTSSVVKQSAKAQTAECADKKVFASNDDKKNNHKDETCSPVRKWQRLDKNDSNDNTQGISDSSSEGIPLGCVTTVIRSKEKLKKFALISTTEDYECKSSNIHKIDVSQLNTDNSSTKLTDKNAIAENVEVLQTSVENTNDQKPSSKLTDKHAIAENVEVLRTSVENTEDQKPSTSKHIETSTPTGTDRLNKYSALKTDEKRPVGKKLEKKSVKYTPLEQQYLQLKEKYPTAVLLVECGYKYRFFGEGAKIAADVLKIFAHEDHNFLTASIPVHRVHVHTRRLVAAGYKVGIVQQTETAALKAAGTNKNAPFTRKLTALYTKSTIIGQEVERSAEDGAPTDLVTTATSYLVCICEDEPQKGKKRTRQIGIMAVEPCTGDVVYEIFDDSATRSELETRLSVIQPVEVLVSDTVSVETRKLLNSFQTFSYGDDRLRLEEMDKDVFDVSTVFRRLSDFYKDVTDSLQLAINLPSLVQCCLAVLISYLSDFNLDSILTEISNFTKFSSTCRGMGLDTHVLKNLNIFRNDVDGREQGSLFSIINYTVSHPGARMLRAWLARPLTSYSEILERQEAVQELLDDRHGNLNTINAMLLRLPDLEQKLTAAYHKKCNPSDFYHMCDALQNLHDTFTAYHEAGKDYVTLLLGNITMEIREHLDEVADLMKYLDKNAASKNNKAELFVDDAVYPQIAECRRKIKNILDEIQGHKRYVRLTIGQPAAEFTTVLNTEFLIEVKNLHISLVPKDWTKISSTKMVSRFHTPFIVEKYKELQQAREQLVIQSDEAWKHFLDGFSCHYQSYKRAVKMLAQLDCLMSLAALARNEGYTRPEIQKDLMCIEIVEGCHPIVQQHMSRTQQYVPNSTSLSMSGERVMVITGPNMGGKSCYIGQVALLCILAQIGSHVPARSAKLGILDAIYIRMGAADDIYKGRSTFMVELQETSNILAKATTRSLVILDELGRGTSTHDGAAIAYASLKYFIDKVKCLTLFVTHYPLMTEFEELYHGVVANYHMSFCLDDEPSIASTSDGDESDVTFLYQLARGKAGRSYGLNVARLADIPTFIVTEAKVKSHSMEEQESIFMKRHTLLKTLMTGDPDLHKFLHHPNWTCI